MLLQQEGIRKRNIIIYSVKDIHRSGNFSRAGGGGEVVQEWPLAWKLKGVKF